MTHYMEIDNLMMLEPFLEISRVSRRVKYLPVPLDEKTTMYAARVPLFLKKQFHTAVRRHFGDVEFLATFYRLNTSKVDTSIRIHSDSEINEVKPDFGMVFYLEDDPGSGTALYSHKVFGDSSRANRVFDNEAGWEQSFVSQSRANKLFIFNSNLFHGRTPWKAKGVDATDGRVVICTFAKQRTKDDN